MKSPLESPQQWLPVWLVETGGLYQLVKVRIVLLFTLCYIITGVSCGDPPTITNASPGTPSSTTYRGAVTYTCDTGYWIRRGFTRARATCMAGKKWGRLPTCTSMWHCLAICIIFIHSVVDCGSPPTVRNGYPGTPTSTTFGGTVSYMCNSNRYHMSGSATVTCEASGSWSTIPTCSGE